MNDLTLYQNTIPLFEYHNEDIWKISTYDPTPPKVPPKQLLKWVGNKQRFATQIASVFPSNFNTFYEPFVGSGAVLGALGPKRAFAGDILRPLIEMWKILQTNPQELYDHYEKCWLSYMKDPKTTYKEILDSYNTNPNPLDFVFISRSCYGGVIRFTKLGKMSTPIGPHTPISPASFKERMKLWRTRVQHTKFLNTSFEETLTGVSEGDIIYCDPPYVDSQAILYGAQAFKLPQLWEEIEKCKYKGAKIALSIDGHKKSGMKVVQLDIPKGLFERELLISGGSSMLKRLQKKDEIMVGEDVDDRLLLTW